MKFSEMPYERPNLEEMKRQAAAFTEQLKAAASYEEARTVFLQKEEADRHMRTLASLASIRHSIDTRDAYYNEEKNSGMPPNPSCRSMSSSGRWPCWRVRSARILRQNTET